ncbi:MAG: hypothetical protein XD93_0401 [candidate division WS6 bacterium 34_10]|uniref:Uncharacterized protein n=1 Tax=candidate division WS6 bacterium 34_10 TaxID=1641389 RepID=A0A117M0F0_9BACT|nr:MAG: hypothetical protein XD93_0401 [candidate division WS6 bacterium 34_10]
MIRSSELSAGIESERNIESSYQEEMASSFEDAVNKSIESYFFEKDRENSFALVDIDGCLIEDNRIKIPFLSHRYEPVISDENKEAFLNLVTAFNGSVAVITNRGTKDNIVWNTGRVFSKVKNFLKSEELNLEIYKSLLRQFPFIKRGDTENFVEYLGQKVNQSKRGVLDIYSIEDWSIASLNRGTFYRFVSKEIENRYGGVLRVKNFVVKR